MTSRMIAVVASLLGCAVFYAQPLMLPRIGAGRDAHARWRTINGLAGTLLTGPVLFENVSAGASNGSRQVVQTSSNLLVAESDGMVLTRHPIANGPAILAISASGGSALAWITGTSTLLCWRANDPTWRSIPITVSGAVVALGLEGTAASLVVHQEDRWTRLTIDLTSQSITAELALPPLSNVVQLASNGTLFWADSDDLHQLDPAGMETRSPLPGPVTGLSALGPNWLLVTGENGQIRAIRCQGSQVDWFDLPPGDEQ